MVGVGEMTGTSLQQRPSDSPWHRPSCTGPPSGEPRNPGGVNVGW